MGVHEQYYVCIGSFTRKGAEFVIPVLHGYFLSWGDQARLHRRLRFLKTFSIVFFPSLWDTCLPSHRSRPRTRTGGGAWGCRPGRTGQGRRGGRGEGTARTSPRRSCPSRSRDLEHGERELSLRCCLITTFEYADDTIYSFCRPTYLTSE